MANAKADLILDRLGQLSRITSALASTFEEQKLEARLDVAYDRIAEAAVELEDAQDHLQSVIAQEGAGSSAAGASGGAKGSRISASGTQLDSGPEAGGASSAP